MERSGPHPLDNAATVVIRAELVLEETGSAFHPGGYYTLSYTVNHFVVLVPALSVCAL